MAIDNEMADELISGKAKKSLSYHSDYGQLTYFEIKKLAAGHPPDRKARQMKKLIEQRHRLQKKGWRRKL